MLALSLEIAEVMTVSKYTTELRYICENLAGQKMSDGLNGINNIILKARPLLFDFNYPIFDSSYKSVLETKIIRHFYTREIGLETVGLFKFFLENKMNEIMPYYNQLYKSELLEFNPLYDVDLTRKHNSVKDGNTKTTGSTNVVRNDTTNNTSAFSDTPQGGLDGVISSDYLTNVTKDSGSSDSTGSTTVNDSVNVTDIEDYLETVKGKQGTQSYSSLIKEYRENFLNIDMLVIAELEDLFMSLW